MRMAHIIANQFFDRYDAPPEVIEMLLQGDPTKTTLFKPGTYDQLPIHIACRCNLAPDSIKLLLDYDAEKKTLAVEDNAGRLAIHVAYLRNSHIQVIRMLLEAMLFGRIDRIGLDMWKRDMRHYLKSMDTHERDFNTADKLEMTREAFKTFLERAFVLELGIWKAACLVGGCSTLRRCKSCSAEPERRVCRQSGIGADGDQHPRTGRWERASRR